MLVGVVWYMGEVVMCLTGYGSKESGGEAEGGGGRGAELDVMFSRSKNNAAGSSGNVVLEQKQQRGVFFVVSAPNKRHFQLVADFILGV